MDEVRNELLVSAGPLPPCFEEQQRIDEQLGIDRQMGIEPIIISRLSDAEVLRESHGYAHPQEACTEATA
ncbi:hypothetical protein GCM10009857_29380 [Agromyces soli]